MSSSERINLTSAEVNALTKAIMYLKFICEETDSLLYAGSPLINSVFDKLTTMYGTQHQWDHIFKALPGIHEASVRQKIRISEIEEDSTLADNTREQLFRDCIYPYKIETE